MTAVQMPEVAAAHKCTITFMHRSCMRLFVSSPKLCFMTLIMTVLAGKVWTFFHSCQAPLADRMLSCG